MVEGRTFPAHMLILHKGKIPVVVATVQGHHRQGRTAWLLLEVGHQRPLLRRRSETDKRLFQNYEGALVTHMLPVLDFKLSA